MTARRARATFGDCGFSASTRPLRQHGLTYNRFVQGLKASGVEVDRRMLADLAVNDPKAFEALVEQAKAALPADRNAPAA